MNNKCNIIRDLLPLYAEKVTSSDTDAFVAEHLEHCDGCRKELERMKTPVAIENEGEGLALATLRKKLLAKKIQTVVFTAIFVIAVLVSVFAVLDKPECFAYSPELMAVAEHPDGSVTVTFDKKVTDYSCRVYPDPDGAAGCVYRIEAWSSFWDRSFSHRGVQSTTVKPDDGAGMSVYYIQNNGEEDVRIYGSDINGSDGGITLPRLTLGYYLILAALALILLIVAWFILKKNLPIRVWIERGILYPICYMTGHWIVVGFSTVSYALPRDFLMIVCVSILLYCGLLLVHGIFRIRKEISEIRR